MSIVQVTFPVLRGTRRFHVEKGRRWSVVEHLMLDSVKDQPTSAADLSARSCLPRRVVVEAFIRLMRAGWVEIASNASGSVFKITAIGLTKVFNDQLPAATVREPSWRGFAIEQITGGVFRSRELTLVHYKKLPTGTEELPVVQLTGTSTHALWDLSEIFSTIEGEDELIVGVDRGADKLTTRYAVVTVNDDEIEGLPTKVSPLLRSIILQAAREYLQKVKDSDAEEFSYQMPTYATSPEVEVEQPTNHSALYDQSDLIVDGADHSNAFEKLVYSARERLIIHSTFIDDQRAQALLPLLLQTAERGVKIDVLWGQDDLGTSTQSSQFAAARLQTAVDSAGRGGSVKCPTRK